MKTGSAKKRASTGAKRSSTGGSGRKIKKLQGSGDERDSSETPPSYNLRQRDSVKKSKYTDPEWDIDQAQVEEEVEIRATSPESDSYNEESPPPRAAAKSKEAKEYQGFLPRQLKDNLKSLKNLLKLPKARRWAFCEYFVADLDRVLLKTDEEFPHCLRESFPELRTRNLTRAEWRQVRRLIGKPRRYSQAFLDYEREDLEKKRRRIRDIQKGASLTLDDEIDIPLKIPQPLVVGARVFARVRFPKDGIFTGTVDAIMDGRYRIIFDKDVVMPLIVADSDLMSESLAEFVPVSYFLEKNKAAQPTTYRSSFLLTCEKLLASDEISSLMNPHGIGARSIPAVPSTAPAIGSTAATTVNREERCGNYSLRMIVILVKLSKLVDKKKLLLSELRDMNTEAERWHLRANFFNHEFQEKYAQVVIELEQINKQLDAYLIGVGEYMGTLLPQLSEVAVTSRPEALQKFCQMHASQIVKTTNITTTSVDSKKSLELSTSLTALLLQLRALGQQRCTAFEFNALKESIEELKNRLDADNRSIFEDFVEVNIKHMEMQMKGWRGPDTVSAASTSTD